MNWKRADFESNRSSLTAPPRQHSPLVDPHCLLAKPSSNWEKLRTFLCLRYWFSTRGFPFPATSTLRTIMENVSQVIKLFYLEKYVLNQISTDYRFSLPNLRSRCQIILPRNVVSYRSESCWKRQSRLLRWILILRIFVVSESFLGYFRVIVDRF